MGGHGFVPEQLRPRVVLVVAGRHSRDLVTANLELRLRDGGDRSFQGRPSDIVGDRSAQTRDLLGFGLPVAAREHQTLGRHLDVRVRVAEPGTLRGLVERLVLAEADVAIRTEELARSEFLLQFGGEGSIGAFTDSS